MLRTADGEAGLPALRRGAGTTTTSCAAGAGSTVEIEGPGVEAWAARVGAAHGFVDIEHTIELFGMCADCCAGRRREVPDQCR